MNPRWPIFIPSKGRHEFKARRTVRMFQKLGVPFTVVVEPQEFDAYANVLPREQLLQTPHRDQGLTVTRNFIWDYASEKGFARFWTFDDNIKAIWRHHKNIQIPVADGTVLRVIEDFAERYENVPIAGMHYYMFVPRKQDRPPFLANRRVYSNMLIRTDFLDATGKPYRNECFYNDDTDLCLRVLKDGFCTLLFNTFLIEKTTTMKIKGGMTPHYQGDGRWKMAEELRKKHPDVTRITWRWGRYQHYVDYSSFAGNRLIRRSDIEIPEGPNEYGMHIVRVR